MRCAMGLKAQKEGDGTDVTRRLAMNGEKNGAVREDSFSNKDITSETLKCLAACNNANQMTGTNKGIWRLCARQDAGGAWEAIALARAASGAHGLAMFSRR